MILHSSLEYFGYTIELYFDPDPADPEDCDTPVFLCHFHRQFEKCDKRAPISHREDLSDWFSDDPELWPSDRDEWAAFPVASYIHGGVSLSLSGGCFPDQQWDVSHCSAIFIKKDGEWGWEGKDAGAPMPEDFYRSIAQAHVEQWNTYLSGQVVGFQIEGIDESCWGFYDEKDALAEAKAIVRYHVIRPKWSVGQILFDAEQLVRVLSVTPGSFEGENFTPPSYVVQSINWGTEFKTAHLEEAPAQEGFILRTSGSLLHERIDTIYNSREDAEKFLTPDTYVARISVRV